METVSERFEKRVSDIVSCYPDYHRGIYQHVFQSLDFLCQQSHRLPNQHVSGGVLVVEGIVPLAIKRWGILALSVFHFWGVQTGTDIGKIVARLVDFKILKQDAEDRWEHFESLQLEEIFASAWKER